MNGRGHGHVRIVCVTRSQVIEVLHHEIDRRVDKSLLRRYRGLPVTGSQVGRSDQADTDTDVQGRANHGVRQFGAYLVRTPTGTEVDVVELAHGRDAGHRQFGVGETGNRVQVVRTEPFDQPVHLVPPAPEGARPCRAPLRPSTEGALESMGVGRSQAGHDPAAGFETNRRRIVSWVHRLITRPRLITVCTGFPPKKYGICR